LAFTIVPFFTVIVFPVLVGIALLYRRQPEIHKRLILIATLELVTAGVARIPGAGTMPLFFVLTDVGLVAILLYDVITRGRPHAATVWGGLFLIATQFIRTTAGATATWIAFARCSRSSSSQSVRTSCLIGGFPPKEPMHTRA
jgi:Na+/H+-dicarboxylate symporter